MRGADVRSTLQSVAATVRYAVWATLAAGAFVAVVLTMFDAGRHSSGPRQVTVQMSVGPDLVAEAIDRSEASGLTCTTQPTLTDHIVFEGLDGRVETLGFDEALARSGAEDGWVRSYCSPP